MPINWGLIISKMKLMLGLFGYQVCFQYLPKPLLVSDMKNRTLLELHDYHPNNLRKKCTEFCGLGFVSSDVNIGLHNQNVETQKDCEYNLECEFVLLNSCSFGQSFLEWTNSFTTDLDWLLAARKYLDV